MSTNFSARYRHNSSSPEPFTGDKLESSLASLCRLRDNETKFSDGRFEKIRTILKLQDQDRVYAAGNRQWSKRARTYTILRNIGGLQYMGRFESANLTDLNLPLNPAGLKEIITDGPLRDAFLSFQDCVLTEAQAIESCGVHVNLAGSADDIFHTLNRLDMKQQGSFGTVEQVFSKLSLELYARKKYVRGSKRQNEKTIIDELQTLRGLSHRHLIQILGSYTDRETIAYLMLPVADSTLQEFLQRDPKPEDRLSMLCFYGCLAGAVRYLHQSKIRHRDISLANILVKKGKVFISDFGASYKYDNRENSITQDHNVPHTPFFAAPEVVDGRTRGSASDMWSLGVVFLEIATRLLGRHPDSFREHLEQASKKSRTYAHPRTNLPAVIEWLALIREQDGKLQHLNEPISWIEDLLQQESRNRPSSLTLMKMIRESPSFAIFCCDACEDDYRHRTFEHHHHHQPMDGQTTVESTAASTLDIKAEVNELLGAEEDGEVGVQNGGVMAGSCARGDFIESDSISWWLARLSPISAVLPSLITPRSTNGSTQEQAAHGISTCPGTFPEVNEKDMQAATTPCSATDSSSPADTLSHRLHLVMREMEATNSTNGFRKRDTGLGFMEVYSDSGSDSDEPSAAHKSTNAARKRITGGAKELSPFNEVEDSSGSEAEATVRKYPVQEGTLYNHGACLSQFGPEAHERREMDDAANLRLLSSLDELVPAVIEGPLGRTLDNEDIPISRTNATKETLQTSADLLRNQQSVHGPTQYVLNHQTTNGTKSVAHVPHRSASSTLEDYDATGEAACLQLLPYYSDRVTEEPTSMDASIESIWGAMEVTPPDKPRPLTRTQRKALGSGSKLSKANLSSLNRSNRASVAKSEPALQDIQGEANPQSAQRRGSQAYQKPKREVAPGISADTYLMEAWESASTIAPSMLSTRTRNLLSSLSVSKRMDKEYQLVERYCTRGSSVAVKALLKSDCNPGTSSRPRKRPIFIAVKGASERHNKCVRALIEHDVDVNAKDAMGRTPLHHAIENHPFNGYSELIRMLIEAGADTNSCDDTKNYPLTRVLHGNETGLLEEHRKLALALLLHSSTNTNVNIKLGGSGNTPLHLAVRRQDPLAVGMLLKKGADVSAENASSITPLLLCATQFRGPMTVEQKQVLTMLLEVKNIKLNETAGANNQTALHYAVLAGTYEAVEMLMDAGADAAVKDKRGLDALSLAIQNAAVDDVAEHVNLMKRLVQATKRDWPIVDDHCLVDTALEFKNLKLLRQLLDERLDPRISIRKTPLLHLAIGYGNLGTVKFLTKKGALADSVNEDGEDAITYARKIGKEHIVEWLTKNGKFNEEHPLAADENETSGSTPRTF